MSKKVKALKGVKTPSRRKFFKAAAVTGAAAAALAGYLRDLGWPHGGEIDIIQGEDMGVKSILKAEFSQEPGSAIKVSGFARLM